MKRLVLFLLAIAMIASLSASSLISVTKPDIAADAPAPTPDKVLTTVVVCGTNPDGDRDCVTTVYNDGADCLIIDEDGFNVPISEGPDC